MVTMSTKNQRLINKWKELQLKWKIILIVVIIAVLAGLITGIAFLSIFLHFVASGF